MNNNLRDLLSGQQKQRFATDAGTLMHARLQRVIIDTDVERGDAELIQKIKTSSELSKFFIKSARTEVPLACNLNGKIISRRIDRLCLDNNTKTVVFLDYKTDINRKIFHDKYIHQMKEYAMILRGIYPGYSISGFIFWTHDWELEKVI